MTIEERAEWYVNNGDDETSKAVKQAYISSAIAQRNEDLKAFERFLDKYNLLQNFGHANAWRRFVKDMKGDPA